ncbi:MAG: hypothetical protein QOI89_2604 [Solirubrobacteraceae bacterium]|jgi:hypothetical protein|nr:hypothetical protein [Solirubrobacteraceae bacterium]
MIRVAIKSSELTAVRRWLVLGSARGRVMCTALVAALAVAIAPASPAQAVRPPVTVTISAPADGSVSNNQSPLFSGRTGEVFEEPEPSMPVRVKIYRGSAVDPTKLIQTLETTSLFEMWSVGVNQLLDPGVYTAKAEQDEIPEHKDGVPIPVGESTPVTFTIDTTPPQVTVGSPATGSSTTSTSQVVAGSAGASPGDVPAVTVQLYAGSTVGPNAVEALTVPASGGGWSATFGGLSPGTYTARAEQGDQAGNVGTSIPVTFTVTTPPQPTAPTPPRASFKWFPAAPIVGEPVSLVSSSTDDFSPLASFAWALTPTGPFGPGKSSLTTTFTTAGDHIVRLRVTAADGLSSTATQTIHVSRQPLTLMQPFPIVRIAGIVTSSGVNLSLLTAQAPVGARVKVTCRGRGCPTASESRVASSSAKKHRPSMVLIAFRRFQRSLGAGAVLEVRISKPGRIGKYTRFSIRRGKLPVRLDSCIGPAGIKPIACPSS